ncbi:MAG: carboxypeptidase regulatory-like domain-containing protein [Bryobacteraceae bacterium]
MTRACMLFLVLCAALAPGVFAQGGESTQILGVVEDTTGAAAPGVTVRITHIATGQQRQVSTGESGNFVFTNITPGEYTVRAEKEGFRSEVRSGLILQLNQKARVDMRLSVGAVSETVEVSARGVILNTDDATIGNVVEQRRVVDLPLNGRNFANLAGLMPGVIKGISSNTNQYGRKDTAIAISANGMRENQGQVLYDGVSTAWNINNATFFRASIEAIQEFKVHAGTYSAEYGHNAGAQVEILTRPGSNQLHGALFEFLRNDNFDARNYFRPRPLSKDVLQRNQFGFVLSGPVWIPKLYNGRDRTFWMVNYEGQREKNEAASIASVAPEAFRRGDFSAVSTPLRDPLGARSRVTRSPRTASARSRSDIWRFIRGQTCPACPPISPESINKSMTSISCSRGAITNSAITTSCSREWPCSSTTFPLYRSITSPRLTAGSPRATPSSAKRTSSARPSSMRPKSDSTVTGSCEAIRGRTRTLIRNRWV